MGVKGLNEAFCQFLKTFSNEQLMSIVLQMSGKIASGASNGSR
jgi:hypothetical protein